MTEKIRAVVVLILLRVDYISRLAAEYEIAIKSMQILQSSLEDYYMKLKERGAGK